MMFFDRDYCLGGYWIIEDIIRSINRPIGGADSQCSFPLRNGYAVSLSLKHHFSDITGKNDLHIRIPAWFSGSGWDKLSGKNSLDLMAFGGLYERGIPAVFWQTGRYSGVFFTCPETDGFTGFSGLGNSNRSPNWAYFTLALLPVLYAWIGENLKTMNILPIPINAD